MIHMEGSKEFEMTWWVSVSRGTTRSAVNLPRVGVHLANSAWDDPERRYLVCVATNRIILERAVKWQNSVPHGTIRPPKPDFHPQDVVPRETSCILDSPLLDFRSRGNI